MDTNLVQQVLERFKIEYNKKDRSGIYGVTQREVAYNSNKIAGSALTKEQKIYRNLVIRFFEE